MSREIRRVPLDFDAPLNQLWEGYHNPYTEDYVILCPDCQGSRLNKETNALYQTFYDNYACIPYRPLNMWSEERIMELLKKNFVDDVENPGKQRMGWAYQYKIDPNGNPTDNPPWKIIGNCRQWCCSVTQEEVDFILKNNPSYFCDLLEKYDQSSKKYVPIDPQLKLTAEYFNHYHNDLKDYANAFVWARATLKGVYGACEKCNGTGSVWLNKAKKYLSHNWKKIEPPTGDGYQIWSTVSEGTPISPVFQNKESLIQWLVKGGTSIESARAFVESGWVPTGGFHSKKGMKENYDVATF